MKIPIVNYQDTDAQAQFVKSVLETGFGVITNTFVPKDLIKETYRDYEKFFDDDKWKNSLLFDKETQAGYFPFKSEKAKDSDIKDLKEFFHIYPNRPNQNVASKAGDQLAVFLEDLGMELLGWLEEGYTSKEGSQSWGNMVEYSKATLFRIIHYPPLTGREEAGAIRASAHEDINFITMLPAATGAGLQVLDNNGNWHDVGTDENSIIVNVGDMLQLLTNGYYKSTTHRVVNPTSDNKSRYSMPLFLHPHPETKLSKDKTASQYLYERLVELGLIEEKK